MSFWLESRSARDVGSGEDVDNKFISDLSIDDWVHNVKGDQFCIKNTVNINDIVGDKKAY